jgi:hydroxypyruvate isomerase
MRNRTPAVQQAIADALAERDMRMGVFVAAWPDWNAPTLTSGDAGKREEFLAQLRESVEVAKRLNATWMTVVAGFVDLRLTRDYQMANIVESLKQGAAILAPHGLVMVLEPLNNRDHPGQSVTDAGQAYLICKAVNSPSCKILYDIYHQQASEGNLLQNIDRCWDEIAYFQIGDNPGRKEPTTGEINYRNVFKHLHKRGYTGILGMEHGKSIDGAAGEEALVKAYRYCDDFET